MSRRDPEHPLPYFRYFVDRWLSDRVVKRMTVTEFGVLHKLILEQWKVGYIIDDLDKIAEICEAEVEEVAAAWRVVKKVFVSRADMDPMFMVCSLLEEQRTAQDEMRVKRVRAGVASARARAAVDKKADSPYEDVPTVLGAPKGTVCRECGGRGGVHGQSCSHALTS
jgi:hypothetical protein